MASSRASVPFFMPTATGPAATLDHPRLGERPLILPEVPSHDHLEIDDVFWTGIRDVDGMPPFFTTSVGDNDVWLYAGSNGALCAGRRDPDLAVFPYVTVDRILDSARSAGFLSVFLVSAGDGPARVWEPWSDLPAVHPRKRSLYKHPEGNGLCFLETDLETGLTFRVILASCAAHGIVRECRLSHDGQTAVSVQCLDGWHRLIPPGMGVTLWKNFSYLGQAYMRHDRVPGLPLGVFTLNAAITDRAEAMEVQRAAAAWTCGLPRDTHHLLSTRQVDAFRHGLEVHPENEIRGETGAFLSSFGLTLSPGGRFDWLGGLDTHLDHCALVSLSEALGEGLAFGERVRAAVRQDRASLRRRLASADAFSKTADAIGDEHHVSNTLFNVMRGGSLPASLEIGREAFSTWLQGRNRLVAERTAESVSKWPRHFSLVELRRLAAEAGDAQLERLAGVYLPLSFSRRHGDPSRPWNHFSIRLHDAEGRPLVSWQGNWRDIFQNWEALALSFPSALPAMIASFLDASTADGYNPYRITSEGVDWEVPEPENPWAHFGYWGDHQIVYLQRLLSLCESHFPGRLRAELSRRLHVCVNVPYRLAGLEATLRDPHDTVSFNRALHLQILDTERRIGTDARLLADASGEPLLFSLAEKLLIPVLAKLSNWIPGGGIWLSTQRPEWNDANNALVGNGLSMVTVCQLRRHVEVLLELLPEEGGAPLSSATREFVNGVTTVLTRWGSRLEWSDEERYEVLCTLGGLGERHRGRVYAGDFGDFSECRFAELRELLGAAKTALENTVRANRREDGLYHSYNLLALRGKSAGVAPLFLMLEGQVAVLASGVLSGEEALEVLRRLRASALYRRDQHSYLLYPNRELKPFLERNTFSPGRLEGSRLLEVLERQGDRSILLRDSRGNLHFAGGLGNQSELRAALDRLELRPEFAEAVREERALLAEVWEETFQHRSFLGRSGTMFGFEGLGCIYWHMISKLLLSAQECHARAVAQGAPAPVIAGLAAAYFDLRLGLGPGKSPHQFGAFPTDPYSHTPGHRGAQQPGMTGQVKEELLARRGELGVIVERGCIRISTTLLRRSEFLHAPSRLSFPSLGGMEREVVVPVKGLAFTLCQIPVVYVLGGEPSIEIRRRDGALSVVSGLCLDADDSALVFSRRGEIEGLTVHLGAAELL